MYRNIGLAGISVLTQQLLVSFEMWLGKKTKMFAPVLLKTNTLEFVVGNSLICLMETSVKKKVHDHSHISSLDLNQKPEDH